MYTNMAYLWRFYYWIAENWAINIRHDTLSKGTKRSLSSFSKHNVLATSCNSIEYFVMQRWLAKFQNINIIIPLTTVKKKKMYLSTCMSIPLLIFISRNTLLRLHEFQLIDFSCTLIKIKHVARSWSVKWRLFRCCKRSWLGHSRHQEF